MFFFPFSGNKLFEDDIIRESPLSMGVVMTEVIENMMINVSLKASECVDAAAAISFRLGQKKNTAFGKELILPCEEPRLSG